MRAISINCERSKRNTHSLSYGHLGGKYSFYQFASRLSLDRLSSDIYSSLSSQMYCDSWLFSFFFYFLIQNCTFPRTKKIPINSIFPIGELNTKFFIFSLSIGGESNYIIIKCGAHSFYRFPLVNISLMKRNKSR